MKQIFATFVSSYSFTIQNDELRVRFTIGLYTMATSESIQTHLTNKIIRSHVLH
jgi:hypothetical protein